MKIILNEEEIKEALYNYINERLPEYKAKNHYYEIKGSREFKEGLTATFFLADEKENR